jgi:hypothetical protein
MESLSGVGASGQQGPGQGLRGTLPNTRTRQETPLIPVTADGTPLSRTALVFPAALVADEAPMPARRDSTASLAAQAQAQQQQQQQRQVQQSPIRTASRDVGESRGQTGAGAGSEGPSGSLKGKSSSAVTLEEWQGNDEALEGAFQRSCSLYSRFPSVAGAAFCLAVYSLCAPGTCRRLWRVI